MENENVSGSQTETSEAFAPEKDAETEALYASFGIQPTAQKKDIEFPDLSKGEAQQETDEVDAPPATEEAKTESKKITVKYNKEDVEIDEAKVPELLQKGLALDKQRDLAKQQQSDLDRAAKLLGYKDHAELQANFDKIEQQQQQKKEDDFNQLRQDMIEQFEDAGGDPAKMEQWLENHPLLSQARQAIQEREQSQNQFKQQSAEQERLSGWKQLYDTFPDVAESAKSFADGGKPDWFTSEMESMVAQGYKPIDAYKLAHMDKIQTQTKKATEQRVIKQQHLGTRSGIETESVSPPDEVTLLPAQMSLAAEFGVNVEGVRKQQKMINNRR